MKLFFDKKCAISAFLFAFLTIISVGFFASCSDVEDSSDGKAYITFSAQSARTINPTFDTSNFTAFALIGSCNDGAVQTIGTWKSLSNVKTEILAGTWDFTLTCKNGSATLRGTLENFEITEGENTLEFVLSVVNYGSSNSYGSLEASITVPDDVKSVKAGLFDIETEEAISEFKLESLEITNKKATYKRTTISVGSYIVKFYMYADEDATILLNEYAEVVNVAAEASSSGTREIDSVNKTYKIEYVLGNGEIKSGVSYLQNYSILTTVRLLTADDVEYTDHTFVGWYEKADFSGEKAVSIEAGTQTGDKIYYAKWAVQANITVAASAAAERIKNLDANGAYSITLTGNCSSAFIAAIASAIKARADLTIDLDLSQTTGLTAIEANAFKDCTELTSIVLPVTIETMGSGVFGGCSSLTSITIPFVGSALTPSASSHTAGASAALFGYIFGTTNYAGATATDQYYASSSKTTYYIPTSLVKVTVLGGKLLYGAFYGCSNLTELNLNDGITIVNDKAFYNCSALTELTIPESATYLGEYAFYGCSGITSVEIPSNVGTIYSYCFKDCTNLTSIDFTRATALTTINTYAFEGCTGLTEITIPDSVTKIESAAFKGCSGLTEMTVPFIGGVAPNISYTSSSTLFGYIFGNSNYTGGTKITQYYSSSSSSSSSSVTYYIPTNLNKVTVTGNTSEKIAVQQYAFRGCSVVPNLIIKSGTIEAYALYNFTGLKNFVYESDLTEIPSSAFYNCTALESVSLPDSLTTINQYAFYGCSSLKNITIPEKVTSIGSFAFQSCTSLKSVSFPDSLTTINSYAFSSCTALDLIVPASVTSIGTSAFSNIKSVHYENHTTTELYGAKTLREGTLTYSNINGHCGEVGEYDRYCDICDKTVHIENVILLHSFENGTCAKCGATISVEENGTYLFTSDSTGNIWTSNNKGKASSTASTTWKIKGISKIEWTVSSEAKYDKLTITIDGETKVDAVSGEETGTIELDSETEHTVVATYKKDGSGDKNSDYATVQFE